MLKIQNKNLSERLLQRQKLEAELRDKIDVLQNRKIADDNKLCIVDRYWTQLDEDLRLILERFDNSENSKYSAENSEAKSNAGSKSSKESLKNNNNSNNSNCSNSNNNSQSSSQAVKHFLAKLNDWDKVELEDNLKERVKFTTQTVSKLITNYEKFGNFLSSKLFLNPKIN